MSVCICSFLSPSPGVWAVIYVLFFIAVQAASIDCSRTPRTPRFSAFTAFDEGRGQKEEDPDERENERRNERKKVW